MKILGLFRVLEFSFCPANAPQFDHFHGRGGAGLGSNGILRGGAAIVFFGAGRGGAPPLPRGAGRPSLIKMDVLEWELLE